MRYISKFSIFKISITSADAEQESLADEDGPASSPVESESIALQIDVAHLNVDWTSLDGQVPWDALILDKGVHWWDAHLGASGILVVIKDDILGWIADLNLQMVLRVLNCEAFLHISIDPQVISLGTASIVAVGFDWEGALTGGFGHGSEAEEKAHNLGERVHFY